VSALPAEDHVDPRIEQTRDLVFAATLELMAEHGNSAITVEAIAERSGVARSTIYRRWPDLPRLYFEAFARLRSRRQVAGALTGDTVADLEVYIRETAEHLNDPTYFSVTLFLLANAASSEHYAELHLAMFSPGTSRGAAVFEAGIASGMIRPDIDVWDAADAVRAPLVFTRLAMLEPINIKTALKEIPVIIGAYGTRKARALLLSELDCNDAVMGRCSGGGND
jgi:AcrR family transcriptional regulator